VGQFQSSHLCGPGCFENSVCGPWRKRFVHHCGIPLTEWCGRWSCGAGGVPWRPLVSRRTDRLLLVCAAVIRPPAPPPPAPVAPPPLTNPAMFDPKAIERFARGMAEGGPIIEELAMKNNINNPNYRLVCFRLCYALLEPWSWFIKSLVCFIFWLKLKLV